MSKNIKKWLFIATSFIIMGCIIFAGTMMKLNWDFSKLSTIKYEENNHTIDKEFKNINVNTNTADIKIETSDDDICRIVCYEEKNLKHTVEVVNDTLEISVLDQRKWYEHIGISAGNTQITVYLPKNEYASLTIKESTGDVKIAKNLVFENISIKASTADIKAENITVGKIELSVSTGDISLNSINCENEVNVKVSTGRTKLANVLCNSIISSGSTGDISLVDVIANKEITINRTTGDIQLDRCDAQDLFIETETGHVKGSLLSEKVFITQSDTGRISVPKTVTGGKCEITTDTGDIKIIVIAQIK